MIVKDIKKSNNFENTERIKFWPSFKNTKMTSDYENVLYSKNYDYTDFVLKEYFFDIDNNDPSGNTYIIPNVPPRVNSGITNENEMEMKITIPYSTYAELYPDLNLKKVNWFLSNFDGFNQKNKYSFWFVDHTETKYEKDGTIRAITYFLTLDVWSTFYYELWEYNGVAHIKRMHNDRWILDNLYNTGNYIPNFQENNAIRNCNETCYNLSEKIQKTRSEVMLSQKHYNPNAISESTFGKGIDSQFLKWTDANDILKGVASKKYMLLFWCTKDKVDSENYTGKSILIENYPIPLELFIYISNDPNGHPNPLQLAEAVKYLTIDKGQDQTYYIKYATITEDIFVDEKWLIEKTLENGGDIWKINDTNYRLELNSNDYFYFIDQRNILKNKLFVNVNDIIASDIIKPEFEPHCYTNRHFETEITVFNKNSITFDITTLLNNNQIENYDKIQFFPNSNSFKLLKKKSTISPEANIKNYYLLDNDLSVSYKKDKRLMTITNEGSYPIGWYDNTYLDYVKQTEASKKAGIDNINQREDLAKYGSYFSSSQQLLNGVIGGAAGGAIAGGKLGGSMIGGLMGGLGGVISGLGSLGNAHVQAKGQAEMAMRTLNATYEDAKSKPNNSSTGSSSTTQIDMFNAFFPDDEEDPYNYHTLGTPLITFTQIKDFDMETTALIANKYGYPQDRMIKINSFDDLTPRRLWNNASIVNASEIFKKNNVPDSFTIPLILRFSNPYGVRMWNIDYFNNEKYHDIYNYNLNNYENKFDMHILELEEKLEK